MAAVTHDRPALLTAAAGRVAVITGTVLRIARRPLRRGLPALPGLAGAAGTAVGVGELAGHVFGRGLAPWTALLIGSVFALRLGAELNRAAAPPGEGG